MNTSMNDKDPSPEQMGAMQSYVDAHWREIKECIVGIHDITSGKKTKNLEGLTESGLQQKLEDYRVRLSSHFLETMNKQ